jgi:hypothetical protein
LAGLAGRYLLKQTSLSYAELDMLILVHRPGDNLFIKHRSQLRPGQKSSRPRQCRAGPVTVCCGCESNQMAAGRGQQNRIPAWTRRPPLNVPPPHAATLQRHRRCDRQLGELVGCYRTFPPTVQHLLNKARTRIDPLGSEKIDGTGFLANVAGSVAVSRKSRARISTLLTLLVDNKLTIANLSRLLTPDAQSAEDSGVVR